jgi:hypothetical protein
MVRYHDKYGYDYIPFYLAHVTQLQLFSVNLYDNRNALSAAHATSLVGQG